jgi:hypothetical protein
MGILRAKPDPKTGQMPVKQPPWDLSPAIMQNFQRATQDIKEILGFSETDALQGRDISGKARRERKLEGSMSAYVFQDNMNQAVEQSGRVVNDLLNYIIGKEERTMVLSKKDGKTDSVTINKKDKDGEVTNDLGDGDFDVEINSGPSFAVQKEVALEFFQETIAANPQVFPMIADLWAGNLDIQQMEQVKDRLKNLVPPQILAKEEGKQLPPQPPSPQEQMMQAEMQAKQAELKNKQAEIEIKMQKLQLEKEQNELNKAEMFLKARKLQDDAQLDVYNHALNLKKAEVTHGMDHKKADHDFTAKIAAILSDLHKHETGLEHDKNVNK